MESTSRPQRKSPDTSDCVPSSPCKHFFEPESLPPPVHSPSAVFPDDKLADFIEAVRPFHRAVYLVAFAYTNDATAAELVAVRAIAAAFRTWRREQIGNELKMFLIRITLSEAQLHVPWAAVIEDCTEDIGDMFGSQSTWEWRPNPLHAVRDRVECDALIGAIREFSAKTRLTLFMRDALHLATVQIAGLLGESQQRVQTRLAYGRITLCMNLAMRGSDLDLSCQARASTVC